MTVGIIGGGVMGLVIALRLSQKGIPVHVIESEKQLGGLATWFNYHYFVWDKFYHVILRSDQYLINLIDELGLSNSLRWTPTKTGFLWHGSYISMNNHWELLNFPALNAYEKFRLICGILACQFSKSPENIKATEWLSSLFGKGVYNTIWEPLLESKFGTLKDQIPASIMHSTITRYKSTRKSSSGQETMGYLQGGLRTLIDKLEQQIVANGGKISLNCKVSSISEDKNLIVKCNDTTFEFEKIINTLPTSIFKRISNGIPWNLDGKKTPQFLGVICLSLVLKQQFSPYYVTNLIDRGFPFTGVIEPSNVASENEFNGDHLLMLPRYDLPDSSWFDKSDEEIKQLFMENLRKIRPDIENLILDSFVNRARLVQALWINSSPPVSQEQKSPDGRIWSINSELAKGHVLSNNGIVEIATKGSNNFIGTR